MPTIVSFYQRFPNEAPPLEPGPLSTTRLHLCRKLPPQ